MVFLAFSDSNHSIVLLVVIVPRIVPLEYVSTTLGLHKSVRAFVSDYTIALKLCFSLNRLE